MVMISRMASAMLSMSLVVIVRSENVYRVYGNEDPDCTGVFTTVTTTSEVMGDSGRIHLVEASGHSRVTTSCSSNGNEAWLIEACKDIDCDQVYDGEIVLKGRHVPSSDCKYHYSASEGKIVAHFKEMVVEDSMSSSRKLQRARCHILFRH
jgi:hypothetical protein